MPPAGKAIVVTAVTYNMNSASAGTDLYAYLMTDTTCNNFSDAVETTQAYATEQHTFPTGLPLASISGYRSSSGFVFMIFADPDPGQPTPRRRNQPHPMPAHPMPAHPRTHG